MSDWKFTDPPNMAVIATTPVIRGEDWIGFVSHDSDDGGWQFIGAGSKSLDVSDGAVVGLRNIVDRDPSIADLADLPLGWQATRASKTAHWERVKSA